MIATLSAHVMTERVKEELSLSSDAETVAKKGRGRPRGRPTSKNQQLPLAKNEDERIILSTSLDLRTSESIRETPNRPIAQTSSTQSSTSSTGSSSTVESVFDNSVSGSERSSSPATPPDEPTPAEVLSLSSGGAAKLVSSDPSNIWSISNDENGSKAHPCMVIRPKRPREKATTITPITPTKKSTSHELQVGTLTTPEPSPNQCLDNPEVEIRAKRRRSEQPENETQEEEEHLKEEEEEESVDTVEEIQKPHFKQYKNRTSSITDINKGIRDCLLSGNKAMIAALKLNKEHKREGWIYILKSDEHTPDHVKIGKTKRLRDKRLTEWAECGFQPTRHEDPFQDPFDDYNVVESIIQLELVNSRKKHCCNLHSMRKTQSAERKRRASSESTSLLDGEPTPEQEAYHNEYFQVDPDKALEVLDVWRMWIVRHKPFDRQGRLTPYWIWRASEISKSLSTVSWEEWTQPSIWSYLEFWIKTHFCRKDMQFCVAGSVYVLLNCLCGIWYGVLTLLVLLVL